MDSEAIQWLKERLLKPAGVQYTLPMDIFPVKDLYTLQPFHLHDGRVWFDDKDKAEGALLIAIGINPDSEGRKDSPKGHQKQRVGMAAPVQGGESRWEPS